MKRESISGYSRAARLGRMATLWATACAAVVGCAGDPATIDGDEVVNTAPLSIEDAQVQLGKIDGLVAKAGATPEIIAQARLIRDRMEELNGLVDRIEIASNHVLSFMIVDGALVVAERAPAGTASVLTGAEATAGSVDQIYARFAPGRQIPAKLLGVRTIAEAASTSLVDVSPGVSGGAPASSIREAAATQVGGDTTVVRSALTGSSTDAATFRTNSCTAGGVFPFCLLNWGGGASATATSDHSTVAVAPYLGGGSVSLNVVRAGVARGTFSIIMGEWTFFNYIGPTISVKDNPSCIIFNCTTHNEAKKVLHTWNVFNAAGKEFHFGGRFFNNPRSWNR